MRGENQNKEDGQRPTFTSGRARLYEGLEGVKNPEAFQTFAKRREKIRQIDAMQKRNRILSIAGQIVHLRSRAIKGGKNSKISTAFNSYKSNQIGRGIKSGYEGDLNSISMNAISSRLGTAHGQKRFIEPSNGGLIREHYQNNKLILEMAKKAVNSRRGKRSLRNQR